MKYQEFGRQLYELRNVIINGIAFFSAWRALADLNENEAQALNRYRGFFLPCQISLKEMALLQFSKVFDKHRRAVSIPNLLSEAEKQPDILIPFAKKEDLDQILLKMIENEKLLQRLYSFRSQRIAHHDTKIISDTSLRFGEVRRLVDEVKDMYNLLSAGYERTATHFDSISLTADRDTLNIIKIMRGLNT